MNKTNGFQLLKPGQNAIFGVLLACLVSAVFTLLVLKPLQEKISSEALLNLAADQVQSRVNQQLSQITAQANAIATSIHLADLITNEDSAALLIEATRLRGMLPGARKVQIFKLGEAKVEPTASPPFSYAALDLVNKAEQREATGLEAVLVDQRWILNLAVPIKTSADKAVRGVLFIYFDLSTLAKPLSQSLTGELRLSQSFSNADSKVFITLTGKTNKLSTIEMTRGLNNSNWQMTYKAEANETPEISYGLYLLPTILALFIGIAGVLVGLIRINKLISKNTTLLEHQISGLASGGQIIPAEFGLSQFRSLVGNLREVEQTLRQAMSTRNKTHHDLPAVKDPLGDMPDETAGDLPPDIDVSEIFRAYDIRGIVGQTLTLAVVERIGRALGTKLTAAEENTVVIAGDGRNSSPQLIEALTRGLMRTGIQVIDIGLVPTPVLYYASHQLEQTSSGIMITGSHNPKDYNGIKIVIKGHTLIDQEIQEIFQLYKGKQFAQGQGSVRQIDISSDYLTRITDDVVIAQPLKVVVDCGNGIAGPLMTELLSQLGCDVIPLYCDIDGDFPNHHPDPMVASNLEDLVLTVKSQKADLGIALDGDGDRLVAVTRQGEIIWPDRLLMLFSKDVVSRNPGCDVVFDVKCSKHLAALISELGGRPIISRTGHSYIKAKMIETGALLGGEMSGHICFKERWFGFDDAIYASARLLEIIASQGAELGELNNLLPSSVSTAEIQIAVKESIKFEIIKKLIQNADFGDARLVTIDGLRVELPDSWGLVRASNTNPCLTLRFEADNLDSLESIQDLFRDKLAAIDKNLSF